MEVQQKYEEILTGAESLPPEELSRLIGELSRFLCEKYGKWAGLDRVEEVRDYVEWVRFRDSHHPDGRRFLAELGEPIAEIRIRRFPEDLGGE
jgi:hypothetical protein